MARTSTIRNRKTTMRPIITARLIGLTALIASPVYSHVLMPWSYEKLQETARLVVIAETTQSSDEQASSNDVIEFKVLSTLKGQKRSMLKMSRSTAIQEERLTCCTGAGRYILFLRRGRNGLYESVHGRYGVVRLAEDLEGEPGQLRVPER